MTGIGTHRQQSVRDFSREQAVSSNTTGRTGSQQNTRNVSTTQSVDGQRQQNVNNITALLRDYFTGGDDMHELINSRATELDRMGYNPESIRAVFSKGEKLDNWTAALSNTIATISFAVSGFPGEALGKAVSHTLHASTGSMASDVIGGVAGGGMAMVLKAFSDKVLANALKDAKWMDADKAHLLPEMQQLVERREGLGYSMKHALIGGLGFDARNVVTGLAAIGAAGTLSEADGRKVNTSMSTILTPAAGALSSVLSHQKNSLHGPEFLLGRTDWRERFVQLDNTSVSDQMLSGGKDRLLTALRDMLSPRELAKGVVNPFSGNMVAEIMTLGMGLGGVNALKNLTRHGLQGEAMNAAAKQTVEQAVNILASAAAYAAQGIAGTLAGPAPTRNDETIDAFFNNHPLLEPKNWLGNRTDAAVTEVSDDTASEASLQPEENRQTEDIPLRNLSRSASVAPSETQAITDEAEVVQSARQEGTPRPASPASSQPQVTTEEQERVQTEQPNPLSNSERASLASHDGSITPQEHIRDDVSSHTGIRQTPRVRQDSDNASLATIDTFKTAPEGVTTAQNSTPQISSDHDVPSPRHSSESARSQRSTASSDRAVLAQVTSREQLSALQMERRVSAMSEAKTQSVPGAWVSDDEGSVAGSH
ncbi:hypothetical protein [Erwinia sp. V71]|uniref:hypothetical protein n=1 Tax=Erwinia sp. V71 TaxID=3369424 RepID=UPI003F644A0C